MAVLLIVFFASIVLSVGAVSFVLKLSHRKAWYDQIDGRKIHSGNIPRLGGIGFVSAFFVVVAGLGVYYNFAGRNILQFLPFAAAMAIMLVSGAYDDFKPLPPRYKFLLQFAAAIVVIGFGFGFGFGFDRILYVGGGVLIDLGFLSIPLTFFWIVGITNAFNLIDGVDGLAGGVSALIVFFLGLIFFSFVGASRSVIFCAALLGVLIGFLIFNAPFPRAKIFMGDCGSQFLGFTLAIIPLLKEADRPSSLPLLYAAALFSIPIFDTIAAVWRRLRDGKKVYDPDKSHLHHKLINLGLSARGVIAVVFSMQIIIGVLVFISIRIEGIDSLFILGTVYFLVIVFFTTIHYINRAKLLKNADINTEDVN